MGAVVHALPLITLMIDFVFNRIYVEAWLIIPIVLVKAIYCVFNLLITLRRGKPIYYILDWCE